MSGPSRAVGLPLGLALLCMIVSPVLEDAPGWSWTFWLLAAAAAWLFGRLPSATPSGHAGTGLGALGPALACLGLACALEAGLGLWHQEPLRAMRQDGKALVALLVAAALWRHGAHRAMGPREGSGSHDWRVSLSQALVWSLGLQLMVAAIVALVWPRADLPGTAIPWATSTALAVVVLAPLALIGPSGTRPDRARRIALGLAVLAGIVAIVGSRSRSAWIVMPWLLFLGVAISANRRLAGAWALSVLIVALAAGIGYDSLQPPQVERGLRLLDLLAEVASLSAPEPGSSLGSRILLWQAAWQSVLEHPLAGIGAQQRIALVQDVIPPASMPSVQPLTHVHQQFLNQAVDHGLPGLAAAILSACAPLAMAWRAGPGQMRWQCLGIGVVHGTGLLFNANMTHGSYAFCLAVALLGVVLMRPQSRGEETDG